MSFAISVLPEADADVDELAAYIARDSIDQAIRFYDSVEATYKVLQDAPGRWPIYGLTHPLLRQVRKRSVIGFRNYLIFYSIDADMVQIIRILHGARDIPSLLGDSDNP